MSERLRGLVLLVTLLLWSPVLPGLINGARDVGDAALRFAAALLLAWGGVAALHALVSAYTPQEKPPSPDQEHDREPAQARRRANDASAAATERTAADAA